MDSLRPERDELDQFNRRQTKQKKSKQKRAAKEDVGDRGGILIFIAFILLSVCVFLGWAYMNQQVQLEELKDELKDASSFIGQSKLLMARFEGELSETDAVIMESGSEVEKKLAFLDSEMRKLWGVTNDRNKKAIKDNALGLEALQSNMSTLKKQQTQHAKKVDGRLSSIENKIQQIESMTQVAASEMSVTREWLNEEIVQLKGSVDGMAQVDGLIDENKKAIESIDASRRQLNERVIKLERQLNALQLKLNAPAQASGAP